MSEQQVTAGFRNAGWTMGALPDDTRVTVHALATHDGAAVTGLLYSRSASDIVLCIMHPREFMASHYLIPDLVGAGFAVWTQTSRAVGQDLRLEHELALMDASAGMAFLNSHGFRRTILIGNSGGASLYGFYNQQSLLAPDQRLSRTVGGRPIDLAGTSMPHADGMIFVSPHPGQGQILMRCIDPAVTDEADPMSNNPELDFLDPANGFQGAGQSACYDPSFVERHSQGQHARVGRLDTIARDMIAERFAARKRAKATGAEDDRRKAAFGGILTIWRTDADLRCWDLSLDPSDRKLGSVWGKDPYAANFGVPGFGRLCSPEAWLSTWSGLSSKANLFETARGIEQPCLQIEYTGDNTVFPGDGNAVFGALATSDKERHRFRGDHHGRALEAGEVPGRTQAAEAIIAWTRDKFG